ncbi:MAG: hypothetical protein NVS9B12_02960 [Vulcanimicrobiaceae bacterium]
MNEVVRTVMSLLFGGKAVPASSWRSYFRAFHAERAGTAMQLFHALRDERGKTSYDFLAQALPADARVILDAGCGEGTFAEFARAALPGCDFTGVDITAESVAIASRERADERTRFLQADVAALPFEDASFDAVVSHLALLLFEPLEPAAKELRRVLRSGGCAAFITEDTGPGRGLYADLVREAVRFIRTFHPRFHVERTNAHVVTAADQTAALEACGFHSITIESIGVGTLATAREVAGAFSNMYVFGSLEGVLQRAFGEHLLAFAAELAQDSGLLKLEVPLRLVRCR